MRDLLHVPHPAAITTLVRVSYRGGLLLVRAEGHSGNRRGRDVLNPSMVDAANIDTTVKAH
jgi:hypothetical protein